MKGGCGVPSVACLPRLLLVLCLVGSLSVDILPCTVADRVADRDQRLIYTSHVKVYWSHQEYDEWRFLYCPSSRYGFEICVGAPTARLGIHIFGLSGQWCEKNALQMLPLVPCAVPCVIWSAYCASVVCAGCQ